MSPAEASASVHSAAELFEPPAEKEGFRGVVKLTGAAAETQEVLRRWTSEEMPSVARDAPAAEQSRELATEEDEYERPPPPLSRFGDWIQASTFEELEAQDFQHR